MPDVHEDLRDRLTSVGVNELDVHEKRNTLLVFRDIRTDHFTGDIYHWLVMCELSHMEKGCTYSKAPVSHPDQERKWDCRQRAFPGRRGESSPAGQSGGWCSEQRGRAP